MSNICRQISQTKVIKINRTERLTQSRSTTSLVYSFESIEICKQCRDIAIVLILFERIPDLLAQSTSYGHLEKGIRSSQGLWLLQNCFSGDTRKSLASESRIHRSEYQRIAVELCAKSAALFLMIRRTRSPARAKGCVDRPDHWLSYLAPCLGYPRSGHSEYSYRRIANRMSKELTPGFSLLFPVACHFYKLGRKPDCISGAWLSTRESLAQTRTQALAPSYLSVINQKCAACSRSAMSSPFFVVENGEGQAQGESEHWSRWEWHHARIRR